MGLLDDHSVRREVEAMGADHPTEVIALLTENRDALEEAVLPLRTVVYTARRT